MDTVLQCCLNGERRRSEHRRLPVTPQEIARAAAAAVAAGAGDLHVHPKSRDGRDSLDPAVVGAVLEAVRDACPDVTVGVTTGSWVAGPDRRLRLVRAWDVLPDHASVNWHEDGAEELAATLLERGVAVEAGVWSQTDGTARLLRSALRDDVLRVLLEVTETEPGHARGAARRLVDELAETGRPMLLHGEEGAAWVVLREALSLGLMTRIGLEDTLALPDGSLARDNAALVSAAAEIAAAQPTAR